MSLSRWCQCPDARLLVEGEGLAAFLHSFPWRRVAGLEVGSHGEGSRPGRHEIKVAILALPASFCVGSLGVWVTPV